MVFDDTNPRMQENEVIDDEIRPVKVTKEVSKEFPKTTTVESATLRAKLSNPGNKGNIPNEWIHNANYHENLILGKHDDKIQMRSSLENKLL